MAFKSMNPGCCACGRVLFWETDNDLEGTGFGSYTALEATYTGLGLAFDDSSNWTGTLAEYGLIIWPAPAANPSWWSEISGGTWAGRIVIASDFDLFVTSNAYVAGLSGTTGITFTADEIDVGCQTATNINAADLTSGVTSLGYGTVSTTSGGTDLIRASTGAAFISRNKVGTIDFVVCGDFTFLADACSSSTLNVTFWENLWMVAV